MCRSHAGSGIGTTAIFAFAMLLIVNWHLEAYYLVPRLAVNGFLGSTAFFFLAGFAIGKTLARPQSVGGYAWRRLTRIYPAALVAVALGTLPAITQATEFMAHALHLYHADRAILRAVVVR